MVAVTATIVTALALAQAPAPAQAQAPPAKAVVQQEQGPPQTDQTVDVTRGTRLSLRDFGGEVVVRTWDRNAVRVQAWHSRMTRIEVRNDDSQLKIAPARDAGAATSIDYDITAPAWLPVRLTGTYIFVSIDGLQGEITVETVRGDVTVKGGGGPMSLKSIEGDVTVEGATARVDARSVDGSVAVSGAKGEVIVETTDGGIWLTGMAATNLDASTVDGDIVYDGSFASTGQYRLTTHDGNVYVRLPANPNVAVAVRTYEGKLESSFPVQIPGDYRQGRRLTFTLGSGGAELDIEAFEGRIRLLKPSETLPAKPRRER